MASVDDTVCPECGAGFDTADALRNHFTTDHLVDKAAAATDDEERGSNDEESATPDTASDNGQAVTPHPVTGSDTASRGPGQLADQLVALLVLLLVGLVGAGVGLVYLPL